MIFILKMKCLCQLSVFAHLEDFPAVGAWVHGGLCQQNPAVARVDLQFLIEGVVPQQRHVVPVSHDPLLHWVLDVQDRTVLGRVLPNYYVLPRKNKFSEQNNRLK